MAASSSERWAAWQQETKKERLWILPL
jgi:hypothetical protein